MLYKIVHVLITGSYTHLVITCQSRISGGKMGWCKALKDCGLLKSVAVNLQILGLLLTKKDRLPFQ